MRWKRCVSSRSLNARDSEGPARTTWTKGADHGFTHLLHRNIQTSAALTPVDVRPRGCADDSYRAIYGETGLNVIKVLRLLATGGEPYAWINETTIAPWAIYVLKRPS